MKIILDRPEEHVRLSPEAWRLANVVVQMEGEQIIVLKHRYMTGTPFTKPVSELETILNYTGVVL